MFDLFHRTPKGYVDVTPGDVEELLSAKAAVQVIDVRTKGEFKHGHLKGAKLMPLNELAGKAEQLRPDQPLVVYCASGSRSRRAANYLAGVGFTDIRHMAGGISRWRGEVVR